MSTSDDKKQNTQNQKKEQDNLYNWNNKNNNSAPHTGKFIAITQYRSPPRNFINVIIKGFIGRYSKFEPLREALLPLIELSREQLSFRTRFDNETDDSLSIFAMF